MPKNLKRDSAALKQLPTNDDIARTLWISFRDDPALSVYPAHGHAWGEFIYAFNGVMEVNIDQVDYITPPPYGIWLPPNLQHSGLNRTAVSHGTLYVHECLCSQMPQQAGILLSSNLVSAIFEHLRQNLLPENSPEYQRLLQVLLDQLQRAQLVSSYLPHSSHPALSQILDYLHQHPANNSPLLRLAQQANMTERTLARCCLKELGMSLHEWRQRLKVIKAMTLLTEGKKVESIALDLGYANASAFINMFKRWMNLTPDQFRKLNHHL
ncbi:AraC family transcriptional regulator [Acinetobacter pragensis]|uniref:AraC family transcriptional regulator n=1 Tax=Acinetobacter pragensis TaxID=1806892 RepID=A0A151XYA4_9GAMM|nr:helix-turn-helix transcriptional regulator [Acinetobacter pragensis]KYQ70644.1 AraC family transcriptional regulator [Acinetobacter pragensis]